MKTGEAKWGLKYRDGVVVGMGIYSKNMLTSKMIAL